MTNKLNRYKILEYLTSDLGLDIRVLDLPKPIFKSFKNSQVIYSLGCNTFGNELYFE